MPETEPLKCRFCDSTNLIITETTDDFNPQDYDASDGLNGFVCQDCEDKYQKEIDAIKTFLDEYKILCEKHKMSFQLNNGGIQKFRTKKSTGVQVNKMLELFFADELEKIKLVPKKCKNLKHVLDMIKNILINDKNLCVVNIHGDLNSKTVYIISDHLDMPNVKQNIKYGWYRNLHNNVSYSFLEKYNIVILDSIDKIPASKRKQE